MVNEAVQYLREHAKPTDTLVAIPDGSLLNYLPRLRSPVRYHNFLPPELVMFGEQNMLEALARDPPDWIVLIHADTAIYDARFFGRDYGRRIGSWIHEDYRQVHQIGALPFTGRKFGVLLLRRNDSSTTAPASN